MSIKTSRFTIEKFELTSIWWNKSYMIDFKIGQAVNKSYGTYDILLDFFIFQELL